MQPSLPPISSDELLDMQFARQFLATMMCRILLPVTHSGSVMPNRGHPHSGFRAAWPQSMPRLPSIFRSSCKQSTSQNVRSMKHKFGHRLRGRFHHCSRSLIKNHLRPSLHFSDSKAFGHFHTPQLASPITYPPQMDAAWQPSLQFSKTLKGGRKECIDIEIVYISSVVFHP